MKLWKKVVLSLSVLIISVPVGLIGLFFYATSDMCGNYIHKEYLSPNNQYKAIVFQRDCGATTGFSTQVSIIRANDKLENESGDVFIIPGHPEKVAPDLDWANENELLIYQALNGSEYKAETKWGWFDSIKVTYSDSSS